MAKITNLIGTTWRLDLAKSGIIAEYGAFDISGNLSMSGSMYGMEASGSGAITKFYVGYGLEDDLLVGDADWCSLDGVFNFVLDGTPLNETHLTIPFNADIDIVYEITFTGGDDISNTLFIDFINTYGTLVSGGEPPTADSVKSKLQSLLTASNAKTGKSDTNLTDAVTSLIDGYGQGGSGNGSCSGNHIIEVDELPEVGVEGAIYGIPAFKDVYVNMGEGTMLISQMLNDQGMTVGFAKATSTTMGALQGDAVGAIYYLPDIQDIYMSMQGISDSFSDSFGAFNGEITDTANATEVGFYAYMGRDLYKYKNGAYTPLIEQGSFMFKSNDDGTCSILGLNPPYAVHLEIPATSPQGDVVTALGVSGYAGLFNQRAIKSVIIPATITRIEDYAFYFCTKLNHIIFNGTVEQWNAISKGKDWNYEVPATKVICADGEVTL